MKRIIALLSAIFVLGIIVSYSVAAPPARWCNRHPTSPKCQTSSSSTTNPTTTNQTGRQYFGYVANGVFPLSNTYCADHILIDNWEPASRGNAQYNVPRQDLGSEGTPPLVNPFTWWGSYQGWLTLRAKIDGNFVNSDGSVPTTTEIFSFAACKWGIDENLLRAVAVQESDWRERFTGDVCGPVGQASYGIMQVKNRNCSNEGDWGGYPRTYNSTTYNVDFNAAAFRGCVMRLFWYNYGGATDLQRGCVGAWFSGDFSPTSSYTNSVYQHLANKDWLTYQ